MLIMWRRAGESFIVGDGVEVEILEAKPNRVKLGIVAPESVPIIRKEARLTREENVAAALSTGHGMIETLLRRVPQGTGATHNSLKSSVKQLTTAGDVNFMKSPKNT
jgi:carbon storage regulator